MDKTVDNTIHNQPLIQPEVISSDNAGLSKNTVFNTISIKLNVMNNKQLKQYSKAEIESKLEHLHSACLAEGIQPTEQALVDGIVYMMQIQDRANAI